MQVAGVSACAKLLREIRNSLLQVTDRSRTSSFTNIETLSNLSIELQGVVSQQTAVLLCYRSSKIITWSIVLSEKLIVSQLSKKNLKVMESQSSLQRPQ